MPSPDTKHSLFPPSVDTMTGDDVRRLARQRLVFGPDDFDGDFRLNPDFRGWVMDRAVKPAAVLIPLIERPDGLSMLLTKRTEHLSSHSGQVAFPGGKVDDEDANEIIAALREAEEEIDLDRTEVEVLGRLPDYYSGSGYRIAPIVGLVRHGARIKANPDEVEYVFEVPLSFLMEPDNHIEGSREFQGKRRYYLEMPYEDHYIWGVTAGMIQVLYERMFA